MRLVAAYEIYFGSTVGAKPLGNAFELYPAVHLKVGPFPGAGYYPRVLFIRRQVFLVYGAEIIPLNPFRIIGKPSVDARGAYADALKWVDRKSCRVVVDVE